MTRINRRIVWSENCRLLTRFAAAICLLLTHPNAASAQTNSTVSKIALIIGNSDYNGDGDNLDRTVTAPTASSNLTDLANAKRDALDVSRALQSIGFTVRSIVDADKDQMIDSIITFSKQIESSEPDTIILIYYAGHAIQVNGANYLLPTKAVLSRKLLSDASIQDVELVLRRSTIPVNDLLDRLRIPSERGANVIILDACRDNPWEAALRGFNRGLGQRGLAEMYPRVRRTLIAFSTTPGEYASDGIEGGNSPYAASFKKLIGLPRTVPRIFEDIGKDVELATNAEQIPWMHQTSIGDVCLSTCPDLAGLDGAAFSHENLENLVWKKAAEAGTAKSLQSYVDQYPQGRFVEIAKSLLSRLRSSGSSVSTCFGNLCNFSSNGAVLDNYQGGHQSGARFATPLDSPQSLVGALDYPVTAKLLKQHGSVGYKLVVGASGQVNSCTVTKSSGFFELDGVTCRILENTLRFAPALDSGGHPVAGAFAGEIVWSLPAF